MTDGDNRYTSCCGKHQLADSSVVVTSSTTATSSAATTSLVTTTSSVVTTSLVTTTSSVATAAFATTTSATASISSASQGCGSDALPRRLAKMYLFTSIQINESATTAMTI